MSPLRNPSSAGWKIHGLQTKWGALVLVQILGILALPARLGAECRTDVLLTDAIQFDDGPLAEPSERFPFIAYLINTTYSTLFNQTKSDVKTDECAREPFSARVEGGSGSTRGLAAISSAGGVPDFRFRSQSSLSKDDAEKRVSYVGAGGKFRFRDILSFNTPGTNMVRVAVTISMDGNVSQPMATIPLPEQRGHSFTRINITDVTYCQGPGSRFVNLSRRSADAGPDYNQTFIFDACPTALVRIDVEVELLATTARFVSIGTKSYSGGYTYADYTQCVNGNRVCYEDCSEEELQNCSGFSIRAHIVEAPAAARRNAQPADEQPAVQLVSAAGFDYSAPLHTLQPSLSASKSETNAIVRWPSAANEWFLSQSPDRVNWVAVTNQPALNLEQMLFESAVPLTNLQQFFRLEKSISNTP